VASDTDTVWTFPSVAGDCLFATVANFTPAPLDGAEPPKVHGRQDEATVTLLQSYRNACREVKPVAAPLAWKTDRVAYDLSAGTAVPAGTPLDLTTAAVRLLVFPEQPPTAPVVAFEDEAIRTAMPGCVGLPVEFVFEQGDRSVTLWAAVGDTVPWPDVLRDGTAWRYTCRELATGLEARGSVPTQPHPNAPHSDSASRAAQHRGLAAFAARMGRPLVVALTARQSANPAMLALAEQLRAHYAAAGRTVRIGRADPTDVVLHQQPIQPLLRAPRWHTIPADLILLGTPADNVLLLDQHRAGLLPDAADAPRVVHTWSPFRGGCHVVNLLGADSDMLEQAVSKLTGVVPPRR
jgi:hypothetical protein